MNRKAEEDVQEVEEEIHKRTSISSAKFRQKMRMKVNILDYAMGEVLSMEYKDKRWQPIAFLSKSLNKIERNYEIHNKEMLVVIRGLENWRLL